MATIYIFVPPKMKIEPRYSQNGVAAIHLNNKKTRRELSITLEGRALPYCTEAMYLSIKLVRALTFCRHLESLRKKSTTRVGILMRFAGSTWGAGATTLHTSTLALVHSAADYCLLVWCCSAHTRLIDKPINGA